MSYHPFIEGFDEHMKVSSKVTSTAIEIENEDPVLNLEEAAKYINVTPRWMRRWRGEHDPRYPVTKRGRLLGWRRSVLDQYLEDSAESQAVKPKTKA